MRGNFFTSLKPVRFSRRSVLVGVCKYTCVCVCVCMWLCVWLCRAWRIDLTLLYSWRQTRGLIFFLICLLDYFVSHNICRRLITWSFFSSKFGAELMIFLHFLFNKFIAKHSSRCFYYILRLQPITNWNSIGYLEQMSRNNLSFCRGCIVKYFWNDRHSTLLCDLE